MHNNRIYVGSAGKTLLDNYALPPHATKVTAIADSTHNNLRVNFENESRKIKIFNLKKNIS